MRYFSIEARNLWGDYGDILQNGFARRRADGLLELQRTGPFVPPMFFPHVAGGMGVDCLVVTQDLRSALSELGPAIKFQPCGHTHIVALDWEQWDRSAPNPAAFPDEGEPENYVMDQPDSPGIRAAMPTAWEVICPISSCEWITRKRPDGKYPWYDYFIDTHGTEPRGLFRTRDERNLVLCEETKRLLERAVGEWVEFRELPTAP